MAALTAAKERRQLALYSHHMNHRVANAVKVYMGAFLCVPDPDSGGVTGSRGYADLWQNELTIRWAGLAIGASPGNLATDNAVTGNTSPGTGVMVPEVAVEAGPFEIPEIEVAGLAAVTDLFKPVYLSNDNDLTLTANVAPAVGRIAYYQNTTKARVMFYGAISSFLI